MLLSLGVETDCLYRLAAKESKDKICKPSVDEMFSEAQMAQIFPKQVVIFRIKSMVFRGSSSYACWSRRLRSLSGWMAEDVPTMVSSDKSVVCEPKWLIVEIVKMNIKTERLIICLATDAEMEAIIQAESDDGLKMAYTEMLEGSKAHPEQREWYAIWNICLDGRIIGNLSFKGIADDGCIEIGYGIDDAFQGKGYATEAVTAVVRWANSQPCVKRIEAETAPDNLASQRVLSKAGFVATGKMGEEGPRYVLSMNTRGN